MNYFEAQDFFKAANPGKNVSFDFDDKCIRQIEAIYTDGQLHPVNHIEYQKLKVTVDGMAPVYVPIAPHRMNMTAEYLKDKIAKDVVYIYPVKT